MYLPSLACFWFLIHQYFPRLPQHQDLKIRNQYNIRVCPFINEIRARVSFRSGNANFCARPGKSRDYAEAYIGYAAPVCVWARTGRQLFRRLTRGLREKAVYGWKLVCYADLARSDTFLYQIREQLFLSKKRGGCLCA